MNNYWQNVTDIKAKQTQKGIEKYGQVLEENKTLTPEEQLTYLEEELVDGLMYVEHIKNTLQELYGGGNILYPADKYQQLALRTKSAELDFKDTLLDCALGLAGESGEAADHIKKHLYHKHELDVDHVVKELGDILWYVAVMADELGYKLSDVMIRNNKKLEERYPEGFSPEKSQNRKEYLPIYDEL